MQHLESGYERVFTVTDYYDGPRRGLANYRDRPHLYVFEWDEERDEYADTFLLSPVEPEVFVLALEDWEIWLRYERALAEGRASIADHPALPDDQDRHGRLSQLLDANLVPDTTQQFRRGAEFKPIADERPAFRPALVALQVRWLDSGPA